MYNVLEEKDVSNLSYSERAIKSVWHNHYTHPVQKNANVILVKLLLQNGAEINHVDNKNKTPYDWATILGKYFIGNSIEQSNWQFFFPRNIFN